ncbi:VPS27 [Candida oxycetoniae]|uniref:Vacuolar protein sorting-associated protein 27 n=1 Tax=Candida oxycetoniae TaxID=497107 RepID=A0AAI9SXN3_9ASCO|nr:VPS27 [Candida oxycetoniae]KAI3404643.2 VPS27 [Candida oxycetoniae]
MTWFGSSTSAQQLELDNKIADATSESIPNGDLDLRVALDVTDFIRSRKLPAQACMRSLKKRLNLVYSNPNLITSTLKLVDLCVKNCGFPFLVEISSREFMDYFVNFIFKVHYNTKDSIIKYDEAKLKVGELILSLIKQWKVFFQNQLQLNYVEKKYQELVNEGFEFPSVPDEHRGGDSSKFIDSEVPPDWIDSDSCMICYTPFSMLNRKHHCRACGGVYCQQHSGNNTQLVNLGIMEPVRVCDNCYAKQKHKGGDNFSSNATAHARKSKTAADEEDEQLKRAIELSLRDTGIDAQPPVSRSELSRIARNEEEGRKKEENNEEEEEEEDADMKAAIAASLKEYESFNPRKLESEPIENPFQEEVSQESESDLYNIDFVPITSNNRQNVNTRYAQVYNPPPQHPETSASRSGYNQNIDSQSAIQIQTQTQTPLSPPPAQQDLSQAEEEQINLFITLMNNLRSDPKKRANIMYDENLNELHSQIIRLKPKVNKSLRQAMDKYSAFLEMSNKLSTITRLYDQFWEQKLNMGMQATGFGLQNTSYPAYPEIPYTSTNTGAPASAAPAPAFIPTDPTHLAQNYRPSLEENSEFENYNLQSNNSRQAINVPTEPNYEEQEEEEEEEDEDNEEGGRGGGGGRGRGREERDQEEEAVPRQRHSIYPANENLPESSESDNERNGQSSDYVTVSLPHFPPPEDLNNELPVQSFIRHASSKLSPHAYEEASMKYPALETVENEFGRNKSEPDPNYGQEKQKTFGDLPQLPSNLPAFNESQQSKKQYEPEPLIDL